MVVDFNSPSIREEIADRVSQLSREIEIPQRHLVTIAVAEKLYDDFEGLEILDLACGHNFPIISRFQDLNDGPILPGYLASKDARVTGVDNLHFKRHKLFEDYDFERIWADVSEIELYFEHGRFDLVTSVAYFGYQSSRTGTRPNPRMEKSILVQARNVTKKDGFGIHVLVDGYWQLTEEDLKEIGYTVLKGLGRYPKDGDKQKKPIGYDNVIVLQKL